MTMVITLCLLLSLAAICYGSDKKKAHSHQGLLEAYSGKHIPFTITLEQEALLEKGQPVLTNERSGKSGRGVVVQDIQAPPAICMDRIQDLQNYPKMVPKVKSTEIYRHFEHMNGTVETDAFFSVGISFMSFGYFLRLKSEPSYYTYTWTLDYDKTSDFDDNVGHWQVMQHPTKEGWSRVLYSCEVKLFSWIPELIVTYLTKTALVEATGWVKKESEKTAAAGGTPTVFKTISAPLDVSSCFIRSEKGITYDTSCSEGLTPDVAAVIDEIAGEASGELKSAEVDAEEKLKDSLEAMLDTAVDAAYETVQQAAGIAGDISDSMSETQNQSIETAAETASESLEKANEVLTKTKEAASAQLEDLSEAAGQFVDSAKEKTAEAIDAVREKTDNKAEL